MLWTCKGRQAASVLRLSVCLLQCTYMAASLSPCHRQLPTPVAGRSFAPDSPPKQAGTLPKSSLQMRTAMPETNDLTRGPLSAGGHKYSCVHACRIYQNPPGDSAHGSYASSQRLFQNANISTDASNVSPESKQVSSQTRPPGSRSSVADCHACCATLSACRLCSRAPHCRHLSASRLPVWHLSMNFWT